MNNWEIKTKNSIKTLKKNSFYNNWTKIDFGPIKFFVYPNLEIDKEWFKKRINAYKKNAKILGVKMSKTNFYVYPSKETGQKIGIMPTFAFVENKEIHGHIKQSPGHEITHILLGKINSTDNLPANGLWHEGICTYLNQTKTNQKKHVLSLNISRSTMNTSWYKWRKNVPGNLYPLFASIVQYFVKRYGWKKIILFLKKLKNSATNDNEIALKIFKKSINNIQKDWLKWLNK